MPYACNRIREFNTIDRIFCESIVAYCGNTVFNNDSQNFIRIPIPRAVGNHIKIRHSSLSRDRQGSRFRQLPLQITVRNITFAFFPVFSHNRLIGTRIARVDIPLWIAGNEVVGCFYFLLRHYTSPTNDTLLAAVYMNVALGNFYAILKHSEHNRAVAVSPQDIPNLYVRKLDIAFVYHPGL